MKGKIISLSLALLLAQPALASAKLSQPKACPTVVSLKSVGVNQAEVSQMGWIAWNAKNHFDTPQEWTFLMFGLESDNAEEALAKYNAAIPTLSLQQGPVKEDQDGKEVWACMYADSAEEMHVVGIAATPPMSPPSLIRLKR